MGHALEWADMPEKKGIGIGLIRHDCDIEDETRWPEYIQWQAQALKKLDGVFRPMIKSLPSDVL
ncbi:hypothetical protein ASC93_10185 [Massilia sp. Root335]|nr:hypothetical protein ASC93_10185 [Massilia sp. Root335]